MLRYMPPPPAFLKKLSTVAYKEISKR